MALILSKIRKSRIDIDEAVFWILLSVMFVIFALFPAVPDMLAALLGIYSTANFLFLFMIFILLIKLFSMSMQIGALEERIRTLVQELALREYAERTGDKARMDSAERQDAEGGTEAEEE